MLPIDYNLIHLLDPVYSPPAHNFDSSSFGYHNHNPSLVSMEYSGKYTLDTEYSNFYVVFNCATYIVNCLGDYIWDWIWYRICS